MICRNGITENTRYDRTVDLLLAIRLPTSFPLGLSRVADLAFLALWKVRVDVVDSARRQVSTLLLLLLLELRFRSLLRLAAAAATRKRRVSSRSGTAALLVFLPLDRRRRLRHIISA